MDEIFKYISENLRKEAKLDLSDERVCAILDICRVYAYLESKQRVSRLQGGQLTMTMVPEQYMEVIADALGSYIYGEELKSDQETLTGFFKYIISELGNKMEQIYLAGERRR